MYGLGRHNKPTQSHRDHEIGCMTSLAGETASGTQKVVAPFLRNRWTNQLENKTRYLALRLYRDVAWWIF